MKLCVQVAGHVLAGHFDLFWSDILIAVLTPMLDKIAFRLQYISFLLYWWLLPLFFSPFRLYLFNSGSNMFAAVFTLGKKWKYSVFFKGWSGGAKVLCILHHWGVQLILAYSWARPAILVVGKSRGGMFLFLLFLHFHSCSSFFPVPLFHLLYSLFYLFSPFLWETTQNDPQGLTCR